VPPKSVEIRCADPQRRDALEESARLALSFVAVGSKPGFALNWRDEGLRVSLTTSALHDGCYLPETAQQLLEAVQAFGISVVRWEREGDDPAPEEWAEWWGRLAERVEKPYEMVLEIV
jgi:hypothetical protein